MNPLCRKCKQEMWFQGGYNQGKENPAKIYTHEVYVCPVCHTRKTIRVQEPILGVRSA